MRKLRQREAKDTEKVTELIRTRATLRMQAAESNQARREESCSCRTRSWTSRQLLSPKWPELRVPASVLESCRQLISSEPQFSHLYGDNIACLGIYGAPSDRKADFKPLGQSVFTSQDAQRPASPLEQHQHVGIVIVWMLISVSCLVVS